MKFPNVVRLYLAFTVTLVGACVTYFLLGLPPFIGVDDANITHVYARNIAAGHGYVYTPGLERVEGSTSILWTLINALVFAISRHPEYFLLVISFLLTVGAIYFSLRIFELLLRSDGVERGTSVETASLFLVGIFGFYAWNVLSLMDLALWTFLLSALILLILSRIIGEAGRRESIILVPLLSVVMGLARPEAMALVPVLLLLGIAGEWKLTPGRNDALPVYGAGFAASVLTTAGLALFRASYFGVPFPNTYYAKVSEDSANNLMGGFAYFMKLIVFGPYADAIVLVVGSCFIVAGWKTYIAGLSGVSPKLHRCLFVFSGAILAVLGLPLVTGGDHFESFRLYQPIYPLMFVLVFVGLRAGFRNVRTVDPLPRGLRTVLLASIWVVFFASMTVGFHQKGDIGNEFQIAKRGRATGEALNEILARAQGTRVAVVAAGGIAFTYKGRIIDMMGLNWPRMAHATKKRSGPHGHSAFKAAVFWDELPELVVPRLESGLLRDISMRDLSVEGVNLLIRSAKFRKSYAIVAIPVADRYVVTYARRDWIRAYARSGRIHEVN